MSGERTIDDIRRELAEAKEQLKEFHAIVLDLEDELREAEHPVYSQPSLGFRAARGALLPPDESTSQTTPPGVVSALAACDHDWEDIAVDPDFRIDVCVICGVERATDIKNNKVTFAPTTWVERLPAEAFASPVNRAGPLPQPSRVTGQPFDWRSYLLHQAAHAESEGEPIYDNFELGSDEVAGLNRLVGEGLLELITAPPLCEGCDPEQFWIVTPAGLALLRDAAKLSDSDRKLLETIKDGSFRTHRGSKNEERLISLQERGLVTQGYHSYWYLTEAGKAVVHTPIPFDETERAAVPLYSPTED